MPTSLIVYFSQGGTTARIAEAVAQGLRTAKYEVDLCDIREAHHKDVSTYELLGIGSPTYYYRPPFNVMDYVHGLPRLNGRSCFVFIVYGTYCGDSGNMIRHALVQKGAREVGYFQSRGADYFLGYLKQGYLFSPDHPRAEDLSRAGLFGQEVAAHHAGKPIIRSEEDRRPAMIHRIERSLVSRRLVRQIYSRLLRVNEKACNACGLCMRLCPTGNIRENKEGHPRWGRNCLLCFTCEMKCPKGAIESTVTWLLFKPFMIYNISNASIDPLLDHVRVIHQNGHTRRI